MFITVTFVPKFNVEPNNSRTMKYYMLYLLLFVFLLTGCDSEDSTSSIPEPEKPELPESPKDSVLVSFPLRVNVQAEYATPDRIINNEWVAVGISTSYALQIDSRNKYKGMPSYRFELREKDNSLEGYNDGETKGRSELSFCYATSEDFSGLPEDTYSRAQRMKIVYHYGKGACAQGSSWRYRFAIYVPDSIKKDVNTIFAQWHGMPNRTLATNPEGKVVQLTEDEFLELESKTIFSNEVGYEKISITDKYGNVTYKKGAENGWIIEQGGYPPLAFGFNSGFFYIKANSDRKWFTDKSDRTNANVSRLTSMQSVSSKYKISTLAYKSALADFPKNTWVEFDVRIDWNLYGGEEETILCQGRLDVTMTAEGSTKKLVDNKEVPIGRNDKDGYYFKFGIYRTSSSTVPVIYNLAGFEQSPIQE